MFNRKFVSVLCSIVAVMLMAKLLLVATMFAWSFFGEAPVQVVAQDLALHIKVLYLLQEVGMDLFLFSVLAAVRSLACGPCEDVCCSTSKSMGMPKAPAKKKMSA